MAAKRGKEQAGADLASEETTVATRLLHRTDGGFGRVLGSLLRHAAPFVP